MHPNISLTPCTMIDSLRALDGGNGNVPEAEKKTHNLRMLILATMIALGLSAQLPSETVTENRTNESINKTI